MNVRAWLTLSIAASLLSGCALFRSERDVNIQTQAIERVPLAIELPPPLNPRVTRWVIITPENAEQVWRELREKKIDLVLFAVTDDSYEELAMTQAEIRNFINLQRQIIIKYQDYYEPKKNPKSGK